MGNRRGPRKTKGMQRPRLRKQTKAQKIKALTLGAIPNAQTRETFEKSDRGEDIQTYDSVDAIF